MIRTRRNEHRPLYRVIVPAAIKGAWRERWLWPIALLAGLIQTGGVMDAFLVTARRVRFEAVTLFDASWTHSFAAMWGNVTSARDGLDAILAGQSMLVAMMIVVATIGLALIAQGALVFGIGGSAHGRRPRFREVLHAGTQALPRVFVLNLVTLSLMWIARFLMLAPLALYARGPEPGLALISVATTILYVVVVLSVTAIHFFALNSIVLHNAHVAPALERALLLLRSSWLTVIEIALILFGIGILTLFAGLAMFLVMGMPIFLLLIGTALLNLPVLYTFTYFIGALLFFIIMLSAGAFNLSFQYRAWHLLFLRLGEGGARAKLHRWLHSLLSYGQ